jgi:predicted metal-dependent RNase
VVEGTEASILEGFSTSEKQQLMDYLRRIQANCERMIEA